MEMRGGTDSLSPAAYPGEEPAGALPDLSPIAILLAALFIGASYSLFTWLRRTE